MKKRVVSLILAVAMTAGLTACGSSASSTSTTAAGSEAAGAAEGLKNC